MMRSDEICDANREYLAVFEKWLQKKNLSSKTIAAHISNVDFYINNYLALYVEQDITQGCYEVSTFLGDWFICKAMWSSCAHIKGNASSFKKFYSCMLENGVVTKNDYSVLCDTIRENMPYWLDNMKRYG